VILGSDPDKPREIGRRYEGVHHFNGEFYPEQPFVVLREATYEEWIRQGRERFGRTPEPVSDPSEAWFYEVSLD